MHALKSPFTGILVGGTTIVLITLIAYFAKQRTLAILRATAIVLVIKMTVSPHSPLPTYIAVGFQALMGAALFGLLTNLRLAALLLGILGLAETAFQVVLVMTIIYGNSIWESIDVLFNYVLKQFNFSAFPSGFRASYWLIGFYGGIHVIAGIFVGWLAGILPNEIHNALSNPRLFQARRDLISGSQLEHDKPRRPFWKSTLAGLVFLLAAIVSALAFLAPAMSGLTRGLYVVLRTVLVVSLWYFVVVPLGMKLLRRLLKNKSARYGKEIETILFFFPKLKEHARLLWTESADQKGWRRWKHFLIALIVFALTYDSGTAENGNELVGI